MGNKHLHLIVSDIRGAIIQNCIIVERVLDEFLSGYFCKGDLKEELMTFLLCTERINFRGKADIFKLIIDKKENKERFAKFKKENPNIHKDINDYVIEERNIFAHYLFDSTDGYNERYQNEKKIRFIKFKVSKDNPDIQYLEYDNDRILQIQNTIRRCGEAIIGLNEDIAKNPV
jgi:hypothetical protein